MELLGPGPPDAVVRALEHLDADLRAGRRPQRRHRVGVPDHAVGAGDDQGRDGKQPGDIDAIPGVSIEVKDVAKSSWPSWRLQAVTAAGGRIPIVLRRTRGVRDVGQWLCQVPWDRWNELGGWVTMLYPTAAVCARTERIWAQVPFADVVALLEPVVLDGAR